MTMAEYLVRENIDKWGVGLVKVGQRHSSASHRRAISTAVPVRELPCFELVRVPGRALSRRRTCRGGHGASCATGVVQPADKFGLREVLLINAARGRER